MVMGRRDSRYPGGLKSQSKIPEIAMIKYQTPATLAVLTKCLCWSSIFIVFVFHAFTLNDIYGCLFVVFSRGDLHFNCSLPVEQKRIEVILP